MSQSLLSKIFAIGALSAEAVQKQVARDLKRVLPDLYRTPPCQSLGWSHTVPPDGGRANMPDDDWETWLKLGFPPFTAYRYALEVEEKGFSLVLEFTFLGQRYFKSIGQYQLVGQKPRQIEFDWTIEADIGQKEAV